MAHGYICNDNKIIALREILFSVSSFVPLLVFDRCNA